MRVHSILAKIFAPTRYWYKIWFLIIFQLQWHKICGLKLPDFPLYLRPALQVSLKEHNLIKNCHFPSGQRSPRGLSRTKGAKKSQTQIFSAGVQFCSGSAANRESPFVSTNAAAEFVIGAELASTRSLSLGPRENLGAMRGVHLCHCSRRGRRRRVGGGWVEQNGVAPDTCPCLSAQLSPALSPPHFSLALSGWIDFVAARRRRRRVRRVVARPKGGASATALF